MKKFLLLIGLPIVLTCCQDDAMLQSADGPANGDGNVTFQISADDMLSSRTTAVYSSAAGGISNVNMANYDLRYKLAVYRYEDATADDDDADGDGKVLTQVVAPQIRTTTSFDPVSYNLKLSGGSYRVVVWADFVASGSQDDLHYDTTDLSAVKFKNGDDTRINDESRDAYAIAQDFEISDEPFALSLTLKRMFAKLRIITTDWDIPTIVKPDQISITYTAGRTCTSIDVVNNSDEGVKEEEQTTHATYEADLTETKQYNLNYDAADNNCTLLVDYIPRSGYYNSYIHFTFKTYKDGVELTSTEVDTDVPSRANWLTTIMGNILSSKNEFTVECNEMFDDEFNYSIGTDATFSPVEPYSLNNVYYVGTADELAWISENVSSLSGATIALTADINLKNKNWTPIDTDGNITTVYGNGHYISNLYISCEEEQSNVGLFGTANLIYIRDLNMRNVTIIANNGCSYGSVIGYGRAVGLRYITVSHCFIHAINDYDPILIACAGGLVGTLFSSYLEENAIYNANIHSTYAGCFVGQCIGSTTDKIGFTSITARPKVMEVGILTKFINCEAYDCTLSTNEYLIDESPLLWSIVPYYFAGDQEPFNTLGGFVGCALNSSSEDCSLNFLNGVLNNITYKYNGWVFDNDGSNLTPLFEHPLVLNSDDEPWNNSYSFEYNGVSFPYGPTNKYAGYTKDFDINIW